MIESPSSPILAYRAASSAAAAAAGNATSGDLRNLRKASTQQSIDVPSHILNNKRSSTSGDIGHTSRAGSVIPTFQAFIPDYTIKAVTDVLYLQIKRTTYLRALKASLMGKKVSHSGELNERELENLLEKVRKYAPKCTVDSCRMTQLKFFKINPFFRGFYGRFHRNVIYF